jgi:hypothetical protein
MVLTNIRVMEPSQKQLRPGDIFTIQLPTEEYLFGLAIEVKMPLRRAPNPQS